MDEQAAPPDAQTLEAVESRYAEERRKRLTEDRGQYLAMDGALRRYADDPFTPAVVRPPVSRTTEVLIVGAGFGGLLMAAELHNAGIDDFVLVDEAGDVGGVWYWNRYPGASCDIDAYTYLPLLEDTGYMPTQRYCSQREIHAYAQLVARTYGVYERALLHTAAAGMRWDDDEQRWAVTTDRGDSIAARFVVMAIGGAFSRPKLPAITGVEMFEGVAFHSSRWNYDYTGGGQSSELDNLRDKTVGIIGTGATAVQAVPWLARSARKLYVVQRTPSAVGPRPNPPTDPGWFTAQEPGWQRRRRENFLRITSGSHVEEDLIGDGWSSYFNELRRTVRGDGLSPDQLAELGRLADLKKMEELRGRVAEHVHDPQVAARLAPYFHYLCKRPCFHEDYLHSFNHPSVELVDTEGRSVERITPAGFVVGGTEYRVDCLIYATGFLTSDDAYTTRLGFDIVGSQGRSLAEKWREGPETFHGAMTRGFPNLFIYPEGNQQAAPSFNFMHTLIESSAHAAYIIAQVRERGALHFDVEAQAEAEWVAQVVAHAHDRDAFLASCTPGRFTNEGRLDARRPKAGSYPLKTAEFFALWSDWRAEDELDGLTLAPAR